MTSIAILASHNGSGFEAIYEATLNASLNVQVDIIISNNPDSNIIKKALSHKIPNYVVNRSLYENPDAKIYELLNAENIKYIFLSGYMKKLSPLLTSNFTIINSHPSLLPKYGGAGMYGSNVHKAVLRNRENVSGVTIHEVDENYDEGKIILQKEISIDKDETLVSLESKIKKLESATIVEALKLCLK